jgi:glyoxylase-like metal-dependent hydrolase (beta-lactamase superfamily II)
MRRIGGADLVAAGFTAADAPSEPLDWDPPDRWAVDGDVADVADGALEVIETPGHTMGHQCYLHRGRRILFAGDHVLPHITPSIGLEGVVNRLSLADFMASLARVRTLDVDLVLPAHGDVFTDLAGRVDALTAHHETRLLACQQAVATSWRTPYEVAQDLPWTRRQTPFAQLDLFNRVLATWETAAHLELLHARGMLGRRADADEVVRFGPPAT